MLRIWMVDSAILVDSAWIAMPLHVSTPASPFRSSRHPVPREALAAGAIGAGMLALLAGFGLAEPVPTLFAAAAVAGAGAWLSRRSARREAAARPPVEAGYPEPTDPQRLTPFPEAVEALDDPLMIISAGEPDDLISRRIAYANTAARVLLRIPREGALLLTALRNPEVLEAVDSSLFGGIVGQATFESGTAQSREWLAWSAPLPSREGDVRTPLRQAVLVLRDQTDARRNARMSADFLANASHELRTPLASLSGFVETLRNHARDDPAARDKFLGIMAAQADRMARLIDDLLSLSRIELNEHVPPSGEVDLQSVVRDVLDAMAPQLRAQKIGTVFAPSGPVAVEGDRDQILQVVQNLVDNAVKYSPPGGSVRLEMTSGLSAEDAGRVQRPGAAKLSLLTPDRATELTLGRRYALLRVCDAGPGIAREHLPRLTERFYRVEGQKSGERSGTGLGLAIVKHVVNRHRGGLGVESVAGEGASFSVYLPEAAPRRTPAGRVDRPAPLASDAASAA